MAQVKCSLYSVSSIAYTKKLIYINYKLNVADNISHVNIQVGLQSTDQDYKYDDKIYLYFSITYIE